MILYKDFKLLRKLKGNYHLLKLRLSLKVKKILKKFQKKVNPSISKNNLALKNLKSLLNYRLKINPFLLKIIKLKKVKFKLVIKIIIKN